MASSPVQNDDAVSTTASCSSGSTDSGLAEGSEKLALLRLIRDHVIGANMPMDGVYGPRPVIYADFAASGRSLDFIEDFIRRIVLPMYANTHTEASATGRQTLAFRAEAREYIRDAVGANKDDHAVIFTGSGSTAAIAKMIGVLNLAIPRDLDKKYNLSSHIPPDEKPVVFISPYEHHSNELSWRESIADVVRIPLDKDGLIDVGILERKLVEYRKRPLKIGSFSAASNVSGIITDIPTVSKVLHRYGALAFFDFGAAGPYMEIDMSLSKVHSHLSYMDAVFISPHKFVGGPGTPGVLVARKELFTNTVPTIPGGGTVRFVSDSDYDYLDDIEAREEGGTPGIVESIRCGLVFKLKSQVGADFIHERERRFVRRACEVWKENKNIMLLGNQKAEKLSIMSIIIRHKRSSMVLHHNFVVAVLNDVFGIQSRGGCSCAGPYGHRLLHINEEISRRFERAVEQGFDGLKPGWARLNFPYYLDDDSFEYIVKAVDMVASRAWTLLPKYRFRPKCGSWTHCHAKDGAPHSLDELDFRPDGETGHFRVEYPQEPAKPAGAAKKDVDFDALLKDAERIFDEAERDMWSGCPNKIVLPAEVDKLRWFPLPDDHLDAWEEEKGIEGRNSPSSMLHNFHMLGQLFVDRIQRQSSLNVGSPARKPQQDQEVQRSAVVTLV